MKMFTQKDDLPYYQDELILHLHELNGTKMETMKVNSTCAILKPLDIICPPSPCEERYYDQAAEVPMQTDQGQTSRCTTSNEFESQIIMQDSQDPELDPEDMILSSDSEDPNLSPSHEPIIKGD